MLERRGAVPILAAGPVRLSGFPRGTRLIADAAWRDIEASVGSDARENAAPGGRYCVCAPDDTCTRVGQFLSQATAREVVTCADLGEWERRVQTLACSPSVTSLTLCAPSWDPRTMRVDWTWLARILELMRRLQDRAHHLSWGILTAADPTSLSLIAAKAVLQRAIIEAYRGAPAAIATEGTIESSIPRFGKVERSAPVQLVDRHCIDDGSALGLVEQSFSALIFKAHGRSYCACDGFLCGARRLHDAPDRSISQCVLNMQCFSAAFPKLDPRRYDAPVMVLDGCGTSNWGSRVWETGTPSLGFFALAGAPGAVLSGDGVTMNPPGDHLDVFWALASSKTMGEATARLNQVRRQANIAFPYFLFGDPDTPAGSERWPAWAAAARESSPRAFEVAPSRSPFVRILLPNLGQADHGASATYVHPPPADFAIVECRLYSNDLHLNQAEPQQVWLGVPGGRDETATFTVEQRPALFLPRGLMKEALRLPSEVSSWNPPLDQAVPRLLAAGEQLVSVGEMLESLCGRAVVAAPEALEKQALRAVAEWMAAHIECVRRLCDAGEENLWPTRLWKAQNFQSEVLAKACPYCGLAPTVRRSYQTAPGSTRAWRECMRCELFEDRPLLDGYCELDLRVPEPITDEKRVTAVLEIENTSAGIDCIGAGTILLDRTGHGVQSQPRVFPVQLRAGKRARVTVELAQTSSASSVHLYRARALLLLNGRWFWASQTVIAGSTARASAV